MTEASTIISNLDQALNCAGKCDCCANLQAQINQINNKLNSFATKAEFNAYKQYVENNFNAIATSIQILKTEVFGKFNQYTEIGIFDDGIDNLQRQIDRMQGENPNLSQYATKQEVAVLNREIDICFEIANSASELSIRNAREISYIKPVVLDVLKKVDYIYPQTIKNTTDIAGINSELLVYKAKIASLETRLTAQELFAKALQAQVFGLEKAVLLLTVQVVSLQAQVIYLTNLINALNFGDLGYLLARIEDAFNVAVDARIKANSAYNLATQANAEIKRVEIKFDGQIRSLQQEIKALAEYVRQEIAFLTDRILAALRRLEVYIDARIDFVLESVRIALGRVYASISALEARLGSIEIQITSLNSRINIAERAIVQLYQLTFQALDRIDNIERLLIPQIRMKLVELESRIIRLEQRINTTNRIETRIETRTLLQPQYFTNTIIQIQPLKELRTIERTIQLQPINNVYQRVERETRVIQVAVPQNITNITNQTVNQTKIEMVKFTTIKVPTGRCEQKNGVWEFVESLIDVQVIIGDNGSEALKVLNQFIELFNLNKNLCSQKNEECECYAAVPDGWRIRPENLRPQMIFQFGELLQNKLGSPKYEICIPHPKEGYKPPADKCPIPNYKKGNWEIIYVLNDTSKITIHALNEAEGQKVLKECIKIVNPKMLTEAYLSKNGLVQTKKPLAQITVKGRMAKLFPEGRRSEKPSWVVHFEQ
jgi:hypothetical protein